MRLETLLKNGGYYSTADSTRKELQWDGSEIISNSPIVQDDGLTVWTWRDGDNWGILRDDSTGFKSIICDGSALSGEDEESLAAQWVDWDVSILKKRLGKDRYDIIRKIAIGHYWLEIDEGSEAARKLGSMTSDKKKASSAANGAKGGRPRQMTAEETALFIEEQSERLCIEHLGYTPATWYQGGSGHNDDRLEAIITADGDIRVTDGGETQIYSGSRTRPAVRRFVKDWLENLWDEKLEEGLPMV